MSEDFIAQFNSATGLITLTGCLDGSETCYARCSKVLKEAREYSKAWGIDASNMYLPSGGAENWIKAVAVNAMDIHLSYLPSQLAMCCEYDDQYPHKKTVFLGGNENPNV